jgi:glycosyltransferase involved in cell wall biosynthesis
VYPYSTDSALRKLTDRNLDEQPLRDVLTFDMRSCNASLLKRCLNILQGNVWFATKTKLPQQYSQVVSTARRFSEMSDVAWIDGLPQMQFADHLACPILSDPTDFISRNYTMQAQCLSSPVKRLYFQYQASRVRIYERKVFSRAAVTVVNSSVDADLMKQTGIATGVHVIGNGCDAHYFNPSLSIPKLPGNPSIAFVGNLDYWPNLDAALCINRQIAPDVVKRYPDARFYLVGPYSEGTLPVLTPGVIATGYVPDVRDYYGGVDVVILPLRYGTGVKNKLLEAAAMECLIVASPAAMEGLLFRHGEHLLVANNISEFATQVATALAIPSRGLKMKHKARELVEQEYSWSTQTQKFESLLDSLCLRKGTKPLQ